MDAAAAREARLQRNRRVLEALGLRGAAAAAAPSKPGAAAPIRRREPAIGERRRSGRLRGAAAPDAAAELPSSEDEDADSVPSSRKRRRANLGLVEEGVVVRALAPTSATRDAPSCSAVPLRQDEAASWIGRAVVPPASDPGALKAAVMNALAGRAVRFSKYSGLQHFSDANVIFVNVGAECGRYANAFEHDADGGVRVTWFAQPRHTPDSPSVERLRAADADTHLFIRYPAEPYLCCGRLRLVSVDDQARPIRFEYAIEAAARLRATSALFNELTSAPPLAAARTAPSAAASGARG